MNKKGDSAATGEKGVSVRVGEGDKGRGKRKEEGVCVRVFLCVYV